MTHKIVVEVNITLVPESFFCVVHLIRTYCSHANGITSSCSFPAKWADARWDQRPPPPLLIPVAKQTAAGPKWSSPTVSKCGRCCLTHTAWKTFHSSGSSAGEGAGLELRKHVKAFKRKQTHTATHTHTLHRQAQTQTDNCEVSSPPSLSRWCLLYDHRACKSFFRSKTPCSLETLFSSNLFLFIL